MPQPNFDNRTLFHCDNLPVLRGMDSETVDLIATDPPFNKGRDFHATPDSLASGARFQDRWSWDRDVHEDWVEQIKDDWPKVWSVIDYAQVSYGSDMAAFLCFLGVRLLEMHRILKPTGSIYLHVDHTAHAYVKTLMDAIFGHKNFRNEVVWFYKTGGVSKRWFGRKHDTLLFYSKSDTYKFTQQKEKSYLSHKYGFSNVEILKDEQGFYTMVGMRDVWDIPALRGNQPETTGYPTQKPLALYERIIQASSDEGDVVLDAFAGCATTPIAAERLGRQWVGIDIWDRAYKTVLDRLESEGLAVPHAPEDIEEPSNGRLLTFGDIHYSKAPPDRTDEGEVAAPILRLKLKRPMQPWQRLSHKQIVDHLVSAQTAVVGLVVCAGCGRQLEREFMQLDHIQPRAEGGANDIANRILLCQPCNGRKSADLTLRGLIRENKRQNWIQSEARAKLAQDSARVKADMIRDGLTS